MKTIVIFSTKGKRENRRNKTKRERERNERERVATKSIHGRHDRRKRSSAFGSARAEKWESLSRLTK